jgi:hypothetical protein
MILTRIAALIMGRRARQCQRDRVIAVAQRIRAELHLAPDPRLRG